MFGPFLTKTGIKQDSVESRPSQDGVMGPAKAPLSRLKGVNLALKGCHTLGGAEGDL